MAKYATVTDYVTAQPQPHRETTTALLPIIEEVLPDAGAIWHGHPVWSLGPVPGKSPVCFVKAYAGHVTFGFWRGQALSDPSGRLEPGAREMASIKLRSVADVDRALLTDLLRQATSLES
jgi:hypothetical protein